MMNIEDEKLIDFEFIIESIDNLVDLAAMVFSIKRDKCRFSDLILSKDTIDVIITESYTIKGEFNEVSHSLKLPKRVFTNWENVREILKKDITRVEKISREIVDLENEIKSKQGILQGNDYWVFKREKQNCIDKLKNLRREEIERSIIKNELLNRFGDKASSNKFYFRE